MCVCLCGVECVHTVVVVFHSTTPGCLTIVVPKLAGAGMFARVGICVRRTARRVCVNICGYFRCVAALTFKFTHKNIPQFIYCSNTINLQVNFSISLCPTRASLMTGIFRHAYATTHTPKNGAPIELRPHHISKTSTTPNQRSARIKAHLIVKLCH